MPIYTRKGDKGQTSLYGGKRVLKSAARVEAYGTIDELNSVLGCVVATLPSEEQDLRQELEAIQTDLFDIGSYLANPTAAPIAWLGERVDAFETIVDTQTENLPELTNFILPGGSIAGATLHQARTVCRRAERRLVTLLQEATIDPQVITYVNRLSDLLFTMARFVNHQQGKKETIWTRRFALATKAEKTRK
jgi:cob(I)alamin adenosyltransferase